MAEQSAVEWLVETMINSAIMNQFEIDEVIKKSLEMEKYQHGQTWDAAIKAHDERGHVHARSLVDFDEYYNDTFKK